MFTSAQVILSRLSILSHWMGVQFLIQNDVLAQVKDLHINILNRMHIWMHVNVWPIRWFCSWMTRIFLIQCQSSNFLKLFISYYLIMIAWIPNIKLPKRNELNLCYTNGCCFIKPFLDAFNFFYSNRHVGTNRNMSVCESIAKKSLITLLPNNFLDVDWFFYIFFFKFSSFSISIYTLSAIRMR